jgi:tyrosyl-tRNA synthetase
MAQLAEDLRFRGLVHQMTDTAVEGRLDNDHLTVYSGFDPTADSLHVGHLLQICTLRRLQLGGHHPIALAGGGTGFIGDPGGKSTERSLLTPEELAHNVEGIRSQLERYLDFGPDAGDARATVADNSDWLAGMGLFDFLRDVGKHFTVNQMVAKESVKARLDRDGEGISFTEFSYMLLQAYDFLRLFDDHGCRLQIGGSDQWGNITMGIDLVRKLRHTEVWGLTSPLVLKADGTKFGKSETGTVWLDAARTSPYLLYQFFIQCEDSVVGSYLRYFTFLPHDQLAALDAVTAEHPERREAQRVLAREVSSFVHGAAEMERAEAAASALFSESIVELDEPTLLDVFAEAPSTELARGQLEGEGLLLVDLLVETGLAPSKGRARTTVEQGGAYVNNGRQKDANATVQSTDLLAGGYVVLRRGKKDYHLLHFT